MNKNKSNKKNYTEEEIFALLGINIQEKTDNNKIETRQKNYTINNESKMNNNDKNKITKKEYNKTKNEKMDICELDDDNLLIEKNKVKETNVNEKDTDKNNVNIMKKVRLEFIIISLLSFIINVNKLVNNFFSFIPHFIFPNEVI